MPLPAILLVPGAWHSPSGFAPLINYLTQHNYTVEGIPLASVGASPPETNFDADVSGIASAISRHADQGHDIVILFHSYGGIPGSSACKGLLKSNRQAAGLKGGVTHLIYCTAFALDEGVSFMDAVGGELPAVFNISSDGKTLMPDTPKEMFYNDIDDKAVLDELVAALKPQSYGAFRSKSSYAAWRDVESTYVLCDGDQALVPPAQQGMVDNVQKALAENGGKFRMEVEHLNTSHSPFLSQPEALGKIIWGIAEGKRNRE